MTFWFEKQNTCQKVEEMRLKSVFSVLRKNILF